MSVKGIARRQQLALQANGAGFEIISKFPFVLQLVEAYELVFQQAVKALTLVTLVVNPIEILPCHTNPHLKAARPPEVTSTNRLTFSLPLK
jgi:hypothetical protein